METITYTVDQTGERIGTETLRITKDTKGIKLSSKANFTLSQQQSALGSSFDAILGLDTLLNPSRYTLQGKLHNQDITLEVSFGFDHATAMGRTVPIHRKDLVVLDNMLAVHYSILLRRYRTNGAPVYRFHAFIPQLMIEIPATMTAKGGTYVRMGDADAYLQRYHVVMGSTFLELWADDKDRLIRVSIPAQKLVFAREDVTFFEKIPKQRESSEERNVITEEVAFMNDNISLSGAIRRPVVVNAAMPAVLFLSGSGRQNRDGQNQQSAVDLQSGQIAVQLAKVGHIVLSYDDRGVGLSENCCESVSFDDEIQDADAALTYLRSRKHVDTGRIFLIGHSAGAIIASKLVGRYRDIAGVAFMAAPGRPLRQILVEQMENVLRLNHATAVQREVALKQQQALFAFVKTYRPGQVIPQPFLSQKAGLMWLKELLDHDPLKDYAGLTCPVLILQAGKDIQISQEDTRRIAATLKKSGNHSVCMQNLKGLDHLFMPSVDGNIAYYFDRARSISPQLLEALCTWLAMLSE